MELCENFKPRCSMEKAYAIGYEQASYDIAFIAKECYYNAFVNVTVMNLCTNRM